MIKLIQIHVKAGLCLALMQHGKPLLITGLHSESFCKFSLDALMGRAIFWPNLPEFANMCVIHQHWPLQKAPGCMCCRHQQSRRSQPGWCWRWRSPSATGGPDSSALSLWGSWGLGCHPSAYSSWASPHWGGCSWALFLGGAALREAFSSASPPPGSSAGWERGGKCSPGASAPPSALVGCMLGWWCGWWAAHRTRVEVACTRTLSSPPPQCPYLRHSIPWSPVSGHLPPSCPRHHHLQMWG